MDRKEEFQTIMGFTRQQKVLDMEMTLGQLTEQMGDGQLEDNVVMWDRYVYRTPTGARPELSPEGRRRAAALDRRVLDLNASISDLTKLIADSKIDQVAGWIWDHDRMTFIVSREPGRGDIDPLPMRDAGTSGIPSIKR